MFKNLKVGQRLGLGFACILIMLSIIAFLSISQLAHLNQDIHILLNDKYVKTAIINDARFRTMNNARIIRTIILNPDEKARASNKAEYDKNIETNDENFKNLEKTITSDREKSALKAIYENRDAFLAYSGEVINLAMAKKEAEASKVLYGGKYKVQAAYFASLDKLIEHEENDMVEYGKQSDERYTSTKNIVIAISIASLAIGIFISIRIVNSIINQLGGEPDYVSQIIRRIAAGDLTVSIASKQGDTHSMVASMKEMLEKLKGMVIDVKSNADQLAKTAKDVATASAQVAEGSRQQSAAASSMATSVEEMTVSIDTISSNAEAAKASSMYAGELSEKGADVIQSATSEMGHIEASVKKSATVIEGLQQQADEITAIVNVIKDIADQTNLLALNAAIEAARAGEQGRGFAVVADEVRKLAERTGNSTIEIATMVTNIQNTTRETVSSMEVGTSKVTDGVALANQARESIKQIRTEANRVEKVITDISDSLKEQSSASRDIAVNVEKIAKMSTENSAAVQNTSSAANHLEQLASSLQSTIGRFKLQGEPEQAAH